MKNQRILRESSRGRIGSCPEDSAHSEGFFQRVYAVTAKIPAGKVASYGQIAAMAGAPRNSRTVGYAMNGVPSGSTLPCHRVVYKDGSLAPEYAFGGSDVQRAALEAEGVVFRPDGRIDMEKCAWDGE